MAFDYSRSVASANRLVTHFGASMTLERWENGGTPSRPNMVKTESTITAVILDKEEHDEPNQAQRSRQMAYIAPNAATAPQANDIIEDPSGRRFEVVSVQTLAPEGTVVLYQADLGTA